MEIGVLVVGGTGVVALSPRGAGTGSLLVEGNVVRGV